MASYKRNNNLPLLLSISLVLAAIPYFLNGSYVMSVILMVLGILWFVAFRITSGPFLTINDGKLIISRGLLKPKEYYLSHLTIVKIDKGYMQLNYKYHNSEEKVNIVLRAMTLKIRNQFTEELTNSLQRS